MIVIALSVMARLGSALYQGTTIEALPGVADQISYHQLAVRVLDGHGFSFGTNWWPATRANEPTAHWSFLYVLFLSAIYAVAGPAPLAARIIQALLVGVLHPLLMWRIGRRLFGPTVGLVSAALTAFYGYFVFYAGALVTESLYIAAVLWVLDVSTLLVSARPSGGGPRTRAWLALGLALASAILLRQAFLLVAPLVLAWTLWELYRESAESRGASLRTLARGVLATGLVVLVCVLPWTVRNYKVFGQFVLLNTNAGYVFFWANHPIHGTDFIPILPSGSTSYGALVPHELRGLNEAELDKALLARGIGFVRETPWRYARLSVSRAREYFKFWPSPDSSRTSNVIRVLSFGVLLPFMLAGVVLVVAGRVPGAPARSRGGILLVLLAAAYSLIHLLTWTLVRYRLPVDAVLMPVAASSVVILWQRVRSLAYSSREILRNAAS